ncbi:MAG: NAD(P)-dependent oxidoreductase [Alphaproteobacteria bacterium]
MPILVTGAAGLIGSRIVRQLLDRGETVIGFDRTLRTGRLDDVMSEGRIIALEGDITDIAAVTTAIAENGVDRVIHTAAVLPPVTEEDPVLGYSINIGGTNNLFEAARRNGVRRVVYPSSIATYRDQSDYGDVVLDEESRQQPFSLYGVSKLANEFAARAFTARHGLDCRGLRIGTVFGHGRATGRSAAASAMISRAAAGEAYVSPVPPEQTSAYIYVDDVAALMVRTAFAEILTRDVYCASAHTASLGEIADIVRELLPDGDISFSPEARGFVQVNRISGARLERDVAYTPPPLRQRIRDQIDMVRRQRQLPPSGE